MRFGIILALGLLAWAEVGSGSSIGRNRFRRSADPVIEVEEDLEPVVVEANVETEMLPLEEDVSELEEEQVLVEQEEPSYRLPNNLNPLVYLLKLRPVLPHMYQDPPEVEKNPSLDFADNVTTAKDRLENLDENIVEEDENPPNVPYRVYGEVVVFVKCFRETNEIVMHSHDIKIDFDTATVQAVDEYPTETPSMTDFLPEITNATSIKVVDTSLDLTMDFVTLRTLETLKEGGVYRIYLKFTSIVVQGDAVGIFSQAYLEDRSLRYIVATKFQAHYARQAFPCFDEPGFKSVFFVVIGRTKEYHTLSNAPLNKTEIDPTRRKTLWDFFDATLKMPAYLVSFVISDYVSQSAVIESPIPVKFWGSKSLLKDGATIYATNATVQVLNFQQDYFNMTDPLPKLDSVSIPYFSVSAMENWGLISYKNSLTQYLPGDEHVAGTESYQKLIVTTVVAHELSHHWFGNLITCKWWSEIWIHEGFATYFSFLVMEQLFPDIDASGGFLMDIHQDAMLADPMPTTKPVRPEVRTKAEVDRAFGKETYRKGAALVKMLEVIMGPKNLQNGLRKLMRQYQFDVVDQNTLLEVLNEEARDALPANVTLGEVMHKWTHESGYPMVVVKSEGDGKLKISQEKFSLLPSASPSPSDWWIPVVIQTINTTNGTSGSSTELHWLSPTDPLEVQIPFPNDTLIIVNPEGCGFYTVLYDIPLLEQITEQLQIDSSAISRLTRSQLLFDYLRLAQAQYVPITSFLELTKYIGEENEYIVWATAVEYIRKLNLALLGSVEYHAAFMGYFLPKVEQAFVAAFTRMNANIKVQSEFHEVILRQKLLFLAFDLGSPACFSAFDATYAEWALPVGSRTPLPFGLEAVILCSQVQAKGEPVWTYIYERYRNETTGRAGAWWYTQALTCTADPKLVIKTLELLINTKIRDYWSDAIKNLIKNPGSPQLIFRYLLDNFKPNSTITPQFFVSTMWHLSTHIFELDHIYEFQNFTTANIHHFPISKQKDFPGIMENMREKYLWISTYGKQIFDWFQENTVF